MIALYGQKPKKPAIQQIMCAITVLVFLNHAHHKSVPKAVFAV
jgi:hypothetical protein